MDEAIDRCLDSLDGLTTRNWRNGHYSRNFLSELGDIELRVPRTRRFRSTNVLKSYARRAPEIDRAILAGFVLGLSTRKDRSHVHKRFAPFFERARRYRAQDAAHPAFLWARSCSLCSAASESTAGWERFLGLTGDGLEMICVDGSSRLPARGEVAGPWVSRWSRPAAAGGRAERRPRRRS